MKAGFGTAAGTEAGGEPGFVPPSVAEIAKLFPQLEIFELLGKGGMGAVYKARQPGLDRLVALKILPARPGADPGFAERFTREARALARLNHPNIIGVYDFGQAGGLHYFLMEYVDGLNLRQLEQAGKLSPAQALQIIPQICEALQFAHDEGIVHRDIKPENVLLDKRGRVKIADFGLAKLLGREPLALRLTGVRDVMGTPHYMAPEQVEHPQQVDHRADIYSLGVVFYEMLTGELPLGKFAPPSRKVEVDVRLDEVVLRTLEKEPSLRYQQASQVKTDVETISNSTAGRQGESSQAEAASALAGTRSAAEEESARQQVKWPAVGLLVTGVASWLLLPLVLALALPAFQHAHATRMMHLGPADVAGLGLSKATIVGLLLTPFVLCSFLIYAALKMMRLEAYGAVIAGSIIAMLVTPTNCVGFPLGIWALVVLARRRGSSGVSCSRPRRAGRVKGGQVAGTHIGSLFSGCAGAAHFDPGGSASGRTAQHCNPSRPTCLLQARC
jgi:predicted Ser/Thr protein kinase